MPKVQRATPPGDLHAAFVLCQRSIPPAMDHFAEIASFDKESWSPRISACTVAPPARAEPGNKPAQLTTAHIDRKEGVAFLHLVQTPLARGRLTTCGFVLTSA